MASAHYFTADIKIIIADCTSLLQCLIPRTVYIPTAASDFDVIPCMAAAVGLPADRYRRKSRFLSKQIKCCRISLTNRVLSNLRSICSKGILVPFCLLIFLIVFTQSNQIIMDCLQLLQRSHIILNSIFNKPLSLFICRPHSCILL